MRGKAILAGLAMAFSVGAFSVAPAASQTASNWLATVAETEGGHRIGNPDAKVKLTEFVSYTCPACARFTRESDGPLKAGYIANGNVSVEVRHLLRDPIDLTAAMLTNCGPAAKFPQNHLAFMLSQDEWLGKAAKASQAQQQRWSTGEAAARRRAIASDLGFYAMMETRGYRRTEVDQCLADETRARKLAEQSAEDWKRPGIGGTPAFSVNGVLLPGTHAWAPLERQIRQFL